ncbi:MAG: hypothetical protein CMF19_08370 [Idiomarinaceae bacterium]|nr:hypothetical protein [Idiomarinaceae bacterium]
MDDIDEASALPDDLAIPVLSKDLINQLNLTYPPRCKNLGESEEEHQRYAGKRELIDEMVALFRDQEDV